MCRYVKYTNTTSQLMYVAEEHSIYGSSRVGVDNRKDTLYMGAVYTNTWGGVGTSRRDLGSKSFELANHLGNVLVTVSDKPVYKVSSATIFFQPEITSISDYYPFGAPIQGRGYSSEAYRFGFNGKENDGEMGTQDYGFRIYDPRLGRFLSVDPISASYAWLTPYQYASNRPIAAKDLDGLESEDANGASVESDPNEIIRHSEVHIIAKGLFWRKYRGLVKLGVSTALDFTPGIGTAKGLIEAFTGKDMVTGEKLSPWERALGIIPIIGKIGRGAKAIGKIADGVDALHDMRKLQKGEVAAEVVTDAERVADNYNRGKAAETYLAATYGGAGKPFKVGENWRYVDNFDEATGLARESKVGRVSKSPVTVAQLQKDFERLMDPNSGVTNVEWMFSTSSKTGKGGFTNGFKEVVDGFNGQLKAAGKNEIKLTDTEKTF
jgi:RHS repeat-associated protein